MNLFYWFLLGTSAKSVSSFQNLTNRVQIPDSIGNRNMFMFIFTCIIMGIILRLGLKKMHIPVPQPVFELLAGILLGVAAHHSDALLNYCTLPLSSANLILLLYMPIILFQAAFCIDFHTFTKCISQILLIAIPLAILNIAFVGLLMKLVIGPNWSVLDAFIFGTICNPIYTTMVSQVLKELGGHTKRTSVLLEGETLLGVVFTTVVYFSLTKWKNNVLLNWQDVFWNFTLKFFFGGALGVVFGLIGRVLLSIMMNDPVNSILATVTIPLFTCYIISVAFDSNSALCIVIIGILMGMQRISSPAEVDRLLVQVWSGLATVMHTIIYISAGTNVMLMVITRLKWADIVLLLMTYLMSIVGRFLSFLIFSPILSRIGYGMSFKDLLVCVWGGLKSSISLGLVMLFENQTDREMVHLFILHVVSLVWISLLVNGSTIGLVSRILGQSQFSLARESNMNNCIKYALASREQTIAVLKMNRFLSDANWPMVNLATTLHHPYDIPLVEEDEADYLMGSRMLISLPREADPGIKEMREMMREARMRILKAKKISYHKQFEDGMLSKMAIRSLTQAVEVAMNTDKALIELWELEALFKKQGCCNQPVRSCMQSLYHRIMEPLKPPRRPRRLVAYNIVSHKGFEAFIYCIIVVNFLLIVLELLYRPRKSSMVRPIFTSTSCAVFLIYLSEFLLKISAYSWIYLEDGCRTYFGSFWNVFDFLVFCASFANFTMDMLDLMYVDFVKTENSIAKVFLVVVMLRVLRFIKLIGCGKVCLPKMIRVCDRRTDQYMAFGYEIGKGYVAGEEEILEILPHMIDNVKVLRNMRRRMEEDRLNVIKLLCKVQKDRPWIAVTIKTRQAMMSVLNSMKDAINELKVTGWADDAEHLKLIQSLNERYKYVWRVNYAKPNTPKEIFQGIYWMANDDRVIQYLFSNVATRKYDPGDIVCEKGKKTDAIYIILTGLFLVSYQPHNTILQRMEQYGNLPIVDQLPPNKYYDNVFEYILSGNCVGELSVLTGRPYDCTVLAETHSYAYVLKKEFIAEAMQLSPDPVNGFECRLWKSASICVAIGVLKTVPTYQSSTRDKIRHALEKSFMPNLMHLKTLAVNEMIEDIILIEGIVGDLNTREIYTAPCYIPRTVQRIMLPMNEKLTVDNRLNSKLLIIPTKGIGDYDIMDIQAGIGEIADTTSSKCLLHTIKRRQLTNLPLSEEDVQQSMSTKTISFRF